jgi:hypothetical protein
MFKARVYYIMKSLFFPPSLNLFMLMCSKLFLLFVVGIWEQWMEQGCCCLPQTLNPRIGDDVT